MDGLDLGAAIGISALLVLVIFIMPHAARHDRQAARRCGDDGGSTGVVASSAVFGGEGVGSCSDGAGGSC